MSKEIRVRFAPSPTGHLHVGAVRTAILNWLYARKHNGTFILRIEDTDLVRSTKESEQTIIEDLRWLGLDWNEGPHIGGDYGPYRQMERIEIYKQIANQLLANGKAFRCFVSQQEIEIEREKAIAESRSTIFRSPYRNADESVWQAKLEAGEKPVIRIKVPDDLPAVTFHDRIKGNMSFKAETIPEFVLLRANGIPSYNFSVVVDDVLMKISHIIRGDDHLANTPKQILVYQAMGRNLPEFAHIAMILGQDRSKLSKRHGSVSIGQFIDGGYLAQTMVNFLSLLGWSSESEEEILSIERLIAEIDLDRVSGSGAIFDRAKLNWMNGRYIRQLSDEDFVRLAKPYLQKAGHPTDNDEITAKVLLSVRQKIETFAQISDQVNVYYDDELKFEDNQAEEIAKADDSRKIFKAFIEEAAKVETLDLESFRAVMKAVQKATGVKGKGLWMPIRVGLTGQTHGPDLPIIIEVLGKERCLKRVRQAIFD